MNRQRTGSATGRRTAVGGIGLLAALGGAAFWWWREHAPLSRHYRRASNTGSREDEDRDRHGSFPDPEGSPGTASA